jgi:hypothetical protein
MRHASASAEQTEQAATNVRDRLREEFNKVVLHPSTASGEAGRIQSCEDFRALIPAYLTASLTPSRRLLFEDHIRECVNCRKALESARRGDSSGSPPRTQHGGSRRLGIHRRHAKWIAPIAAALLAAVALQTPVVRDWLWPIDVHAIVRIVDGGLYGISGHDSRPLKAGQRIDRGQTVRTGEGSGAVLELADGSRIELASRSELSLTRARDGVKVQLARGNVIVSAAKQHGHLYVETQDCTVTVIGTVFAVSSGIKGSRVTVIEGEVEVLEESGEEESLLPGEQLYTNPEMGEVPIEEEIGWSRNAEEMIKELLAFGQDFASRTERQSMRYTSNLAQLAPSDTLVFASLPNVSQSFRESYALFRQRVGDNTLLSTWWQQAEQPDATTMDQLANLISDVGAYLGSEVVIAFPAETGRQSLLMAETNRAEDLVSSLSNVLDRIRLAAGPTIRLARNAAELSTFTGGELVLFVDNGLMIASDAAQVQRTAAVRRGTLANTFPDTPLYRRLVQAYAEGVGWILAVDLRQGIQLDDAGAQQLGFDNVQQLVLEQKTGIGSAASQIALGFSQERRGLPAWLGAPGPMGALNFVSPDAYGFSAWITKEPERILDDILGITFADGDSPANHLQEFEQTFGIDVRRDLAQPLGNEALVAIDGPLLPTPSWKFVFEVHDGAKLENAIQWAVTNINRIALAEQRPTWNLASETIDGKTYHVLTSEGSPVELHYTAWAGYMIVTPSRALLMDAIRIHDSGNSINRSSAFMALLPPDGRDLASAIMYQNFDAMAQSIPSMATDVSRELRESIEAAVLFKSALPRVVFVYGEQDRILGSARGSHGLQIASMLGLNGLFEAVGMRGLWN